MSAVLCLLLLAPPAGAQGWDQVRERLPWEWAKHLHYFASTREHFRFISRNRIDLSITPPGDTLSEDSHGMYDDGTIFVNETVLRASGERLLGAPEGPAAALLRLGYQSLPTVAHEIRHAMERKELERAAGAYCPIFVENEVLAMFDGARVAHELAEDSLELWDGDTVLQRQERAVLAAWRRAPEGLPELVRRAYKAKPSILERTRESLLAEVRKDKAWTEETLRKEAEYGRQLAAASDPETRALLQKLVRSTRRMRERGYIDDYAACERLLSDPGSFDKALRHYLRRLRAMKKDWSGRWEAEAGP